MLAHTGRDGRLARSTSRSSCQAAGVAGTFLSPRYTQSPSRTVTVVQSRARVEGLGLQSQPAGWDCCGTGIFIMFVRRYRPALWTAVRVRSGGLQLTYRAQHSHEQPKLSGRVAARRRCVGRPAPHCISDVALFDVECQCRVSVAPAAQASRRRSRVEERAALGAAAAMVAGATVGSTGGGGLGPGKWTAEGASATTSRVDTAKPTATTSRPWTRTSPRPGPGSTGSIGLQTADLGRAALGLHPRPLHDPRMLISARFSMHVSWAS